MRSKLPPRIILKYYLYKSTKAVGFYRPVMILFLMAKGLTFTQIAIIESLYGLATVLGEIPTGYIGDRIGRRNSLIVGTALITLTLIGIGLSSSFLVLAALWVTWSTGYNFRSGTDEAWLYDILSEQFSEEQFARVHGRGAAAGLIVGAAGSVLGGYIADFSLAYPFFVAAVVTGLGIPVLLTLPESELYENSDGEYLTFSRAMSIVKQSVSKRSLRAFVVYYFVVFVTVNSLIVLYMQPVTKDLVGQFGLSEDAVEPLLGWMYALFAVISAGLSYNTGRIKNVIGIRRWFLTLPFLIGSGLLLSFAVPILLLPTMIFARSLIETTSTLARQYVNDNIGSVGRATVISTMVMVSSLVVIPSRILSGRIADLYSSVLTMVFFGGFLLVGSLAVLLWEAPVKRDVAASPEGAD